MATDQNEFRIDYSPEDEKRFGARTARAVGIRENDVARALDFCRENRIELLIARCSTAEIGAARALERAGGRLADTLIYYSRNMIRIPIPPLPEGISIRPVAEGEDTIVAKIAADAFRGYGGHYQADERLAHVPSAEIYSSWAVNACRNRDRIHDVLIAEYRGDPAGFSTVRLNNPAEGEGPLAGVATSAGKRSLILRALAIGAMNWFRSRGASRAVASVLITNRVMQKIMSRLDFEPDQSYYTFHKWFTGEPPARLNL